jgi:hypothetical protein
LLAPDSVYIASVPQVPVEFFRLPLEFPARSVFPGFVDLVPSICVLGRRAQASICFVSQILCAARINFAVKYVAPRAPLTRSREIAGSSTVRKSIFRSRILVLVVGRLSSAPQFSFIRRLLSRRR